LLLSSGIALRSPDRPAREGGEPSRRRAAPVRRKSDI